MRHAVIILSLALVVAPRAAAQDIERSLVVPLDVGISTAFDSVYAAAVTLGQVVTYTDGQRVITIGPTDRFEDGDWDKRATFTVNLVETATGHTHAVFSVTLIQGNATMAGPYWTENSADLAKDTGGWKGHAVTWLKAWGEEVR